MLAQLLSAGLLAWIVVGFLLIIVVFVLPSIRVIGPTEVGLVMKRFGLRRLPERQPHRLPRRGRLSGRSADARLALQVLGGLLRREASLGPGPGRRDRRGHRPGRAAAARSAPSPPFTSPSSATSPTCDGFVGHGGQKGVQRPVLPPGTLVPIHPVGFLVITKRKRLRRAGAQPRPGRRQPGAHCRVLRPRAGAARARAHRARTPRERRRGDRHRSASSPPSRAIRCRRATSPAGWAGSTTSAPAGERAGAQRRRH